MQTLHKIHFPRKKAVAAYEYLRLKMGDQCPKYSPRFISHIQQTAKRNELLTLFLLYGDRVAMIIAEFLTLLNYDTTHMEQHRQKVAEIHNDCPSLRNGLIWANNRLNSIYPTYNQ